MSVRESEDSITIDPAIVVAVHDLGLRNDAAGSRWMRFGAARQRSATTWRLHNLSFDVCRHDALALLGRSGSGKSTLLNLIAGTVQASQGSVTVNGRIGWVIEPDAGINSGLSGRENLRRLGERLVGVGQVNEDGLAAAIMFAGLGLRLDEPVATYSRGMLVQLQLAALLTFAPDVVLIDTVVAEADEWFRERCYRRLVELRAHGVTVIIATQNSNEVRGLCNRGVLLEGGRQLLASSFEDAATAYRALGQLPASDGAAAGATLAWPAPEVFRAIPEGAMTGGDWARIINLAVTNAQGQAANTFSQGELVSIFYEVEILQDIEVLSGGIVLRHESGAIVHGKNTLQHNTVMPSAIHRGQHIRFRQDFLLNVGMGKYSFDIGLTELAHENYVRRAEFLHGELEAARRRNADVRQAGSFVVRIGSPGAQGQIPFHGLAELPGGCQVQIVQAGEQAPATQLPRQLIFRSSSTEPALAVFHITHWKAGSQWIKKILEEAAPKRIVAPEVSEVQFLYRPLRPDGVYPTVYVTREQFESVQLPPNWTRFVIIRDLRDTLISGYFSMKISHPVVAASVNNLRTTLVQMELEEGLLHIMDDWLGYSAAIQQSWLRSGERLLRYEELLEHDVEILEHLLLGQCRLPIKPARLREIILGSRFSAITQGRRRGVENVNAHQRKGIAGDWRNYFTPRVKQAFRERYGELLIATGYEQDDSW